MTEPTLEELATALLESFEADLLKLALSDKYQRFPHVIITALLEVGGTLARAAVWREPSSLPTILHQIDKLREHVEPAAVGPEGTTTH